MAKSDTYVVLLDEVTLHQAVTELKNPNGDVVGYQQGNGKIFFKDEVVEASWLNPEIVEALENEDHPLHESYSKRLGKSGDDASEDLAVRLGLPFDGYDDMDEDEILAALPVLPSQTVQRIKQYEAGKEARERIVQYSIGFGESPLDRQEGRAGSDLDEDGAGDDTKPTAQLTTREVPEEGVVTPGDGITGTGDPQIPHGSRKETEDGEKKPAARRRQRRPRQQKQEPQEGSSGGDE